MLSSWLQTQAPNLPQLYPRLGGRGGNREKQQKRACPLTSGQAFPDAYLEGTISQLVCSGETREDPEFGSREAGLDTESARDEDAPTCYPWRFKGQDGCRVFRSETLRPSQTGGKGHRLCFVVQKSE